MSRHVAVFAAFVALGIGVAIAGGLDTAGLKSVSPLSGAPVVSSSGAITGGLNVGGVVDAGAIYTGNTLGVAGDIRGGTGALVAGVVDAGAVYTVGTIGAAGEIHAPGGIDGGAIRLAGTAVAIVIANDNAKLQFSTGASNYLKGVAGDNNISTAGIFTAGQISSVGAHTGTVYYSDQNSGSTGFRCNNGSCALELGTNAAEKLTGNGAGGITFGKSLQVTAETLTTCGSGALNRLSADATGSTGGKQTKICFCVVKNDGTTYTWVNYANTVASGHRYGNTTTCPDTDE